VRSVFPRSTAAPDDQRLYQSFTSVRKRARAKREAPLLCWSGCALPEERINALTNEGAAMEQDAAVIEAMAIPQLPASHVSLSA
jgi:hypothetical protein